MIPDVADRTDDLKRLCVRFNVLRLDLFGSAASGDYHAQGSDLDFVVEFQRGLTGPMPTPILVCWKRWSSFSESPWTSFSVRRSRILTSCNQ